MAKIPGPRENDADDVSLALEVAQSQWTRGDTNEALKWLRKAVDAAFEASDDKRGMELSKIAAELKAELDKPAKPKPPMPRGGAVPLKPSVPSPTSTRKQESRRPPPHKPVAPVEVTGTRRASSLGSGRKSSVHPKPTFVEDDEATREYKLEDFENEDSNPALIDEWPTEIGDGLEEVSEPMERTRSREDREKIAKSEKKKPTAKPKKPQLVVPSTRAIRVAVGASDGRVYVRLLDARGLRDKEHDAVLVALTSEGDIRTLFQ